MELEGLLSALNYLVAWKHMQVNITNNTQLIGWFASTQLPAFFIKDALLWKILTASMLGSKDILKILFSFYSPFHCLF